MIGKGAAMDKFKRMLKKSKWGVPILLGVVIVLLLVGLIFGGRKVVTLVKDGGIFAGGKGGYGTSGTAIRLEDSEGQIGSGEGTEDGTVVGKNGVRYQMDGKEDAEAQRSAYGTQVVESSGYDTKKKNTGTSSRLSAIQDELEQIRQNQKEGDTKKITNDMRGKVDYDDMNSAIKSETDNLKNQISSQGATSASEHATIRTTIASNKADADSKISALEAKIGTVKSDADTIQRNVSKNKSSGDSALKTYKEQVAKQQTETNTKISNLEASTNKKLSELSASTGTDVNNLKKEIQTTINNNVTNINNTISSVEQVMLVGTYKNGTLTIKKGYNNK